MEKYIAMVEETSGNRRVQWAYGRRPNSITASGCWTNAHLFDTEQEAQATADEMATHFTGETVTAFVRSIEWDDYAAELYNETA